MKKDTGFSRWDAGFSRLTGNPVLNSVVPGPAGSLPHHFREGSRCQRPSTAQTSEDARLGPLPLVHRVFGESALPHGRRRRGGRVRGRRDALVDRRRRAPSALVRGRQGARSALPLGPRDSLGIQPGRETARQRQRRPHPVGRGLRSTGQPHRAVVVGHGRGVQRRRPDAGHRPRRRRGPVLGRGERRSSTGRIARLPEAGAALGHRVFAARANSSPRRARTAWCACGTRRPTSRSPNSRATPIAFRRWRGVPTGACSSPPGGTPRRASGGHRRPIR